MKIALVIVLGGDLVRSTEHTGVGYIAAYLRKFNYDVSIIEVQEVDNSENYEVLLKGGFDIIGFTTTCITMQNVLVLSQILKSHNPSVYTVCGGHMATFSGKEILEKYSQVDFIIYGEGEVTFLDLIMCLEKDGELSQVKGLVHRKNEKVIVNEERELIVDLDSLPFPARDQFNEHDNRFQYLRLSTSRGCLGNCGFCSSFVGRKQKGPRWRGRSPKNIVDEIEYLVKKYKYHTFDFVDSTFEDPGYEGKERIKQIAEEILKRGLNIYYNCCFRAENWSDNDKELLSLLVKSGLEKVNIGFESGNDRGLGLLNKRANISDNWKTINVLSNFPDIYITFGFIMIHPYSVMGDIFDNAKFLHDTGIGQVIRHYFWQLEIYPGTLMEEKLLKDNLLKKDYDIADGMYKYNFVDPHMEQFSLKCKEFLKINSVWDFEIFDILIHTFITRLRRKYQGKPIIEKIETFSSYVDNIRAEIADFNYDFYMKLLKSDNSYELSSEMNRLDSFIINKMNDIKYYQYQIGSDMLRGGMELVKR